MELAVFIDVDGLLANFIGGVLDMHPDAPFTHADAPWEVWTALGYDAPLFWSTKRREFWRSLAPYPEGITLLGRLERLVGQTRIALLTHAPDVDGAIDGKRDWIKRHQPFYLKRLFTGEPKFMAAGPTKVLIDDCDANCEAWARHGGLAVLVPRPWNKRAGECLPGGSFCPDAAYVEAEMAIRTAILRSHPSAA